MLMFFDTTFKKNFEKNLLLKLLPYFSGDI